VIKASDFQFPHVLYHDAHVDIMLEVMEVSVEKNEVKLSVRITDGDQRTVLEGSVSVLPPTPLKPLHVHAFDNF
jgi:3-hydroxybutyryl-CoA dehydratase